MAFLALLRLDDVMHHADAPAVIPLTDFMPSAFLDMSSLSAEYPSFAILYTRTATNISSATISMPPYRLMEKRTFSQGEVAYLLVGWQSMQNVVANRRLVEDAARVSSTDPPYSCLASRELNARSVALSLHSCVRWVVGSVLAAILLIHGPVACGITAGTWGVLVLSDLAWTNAVHVSTLFVHTFSISLIVDYVMHAMHAPPNSRVISALGHSMITSVLAIMASTSATSIRIVHQTAHRIALTCVASWCAGLMAAFVQRRARPIERVHPIAQNETMATPGPSPRAPCS